jgi:chemotaxis protein CheX
MSDLAAEGAEPISAEVRETLLNPFITATSAALGEMASTEVTVRAVSRGAGRCPAESICAELRFQSGSEGSLVLIFPARTAETLAKRMLAGVSIDVGDQLIRDCAGEIGNVVAGQAKALLAATPYHFAFSVPRVVDLKDFQPPSGLDCLVVAFNSDSGEFALQLFVSRPASR